jgi:hypothetical protein
VDSGQTYEAFDFDEGVTASTLPLTIRMHGQWDNTATANVMVVFKRTEEGMQNWQLQVYEALKAAHDIALAEYERKVRAVELRGGYASIGRPPAQNRIVERNELKKWCQKLLRQTEHNNSAMKAVGGELEIDVAKANQEAEITQFYEKAFEWEQMTYFLHPYFWGRRETWLEKRSLQDNDPSYAAFLGAGAATVLVAVSPSYELRMTNFLYPLRANMTEREKIRWRPPNGDSAEDMLDQIQSANPPAMAENLYLELLKSRKPNVVAGSGTLTVANGNPAVTINPDSFWDARSLDVGRWIYIGLGEYKIAQVIDAQTIKLNRSFEGSSSNGAFYAVEAIRIGSPWEIRVPLPVTVLVEGKNQLAAIDPNV